MIEVFKTNVFDDFEAKLLINFIHESFAGYKANFDLDDCDKILRVKSSIEQVQSAAIIQLIKKQGFVAEVLQDEVVAATTF